MTAHVSWALFTLPSGASALQSSLSALERDISALESQSSGLEPWLGWFTLLVAIGVGLEIVVVIHDHRKEINEWRVSELMPEGPSLIKLGIEIASIVLVIAGVMGEFGVGLKISSINGQLRAKGAELRSKGDQLLALVTQEAGEATERAANANERAAELEQRLADRHIKLAQRQKMLSILKPLAGAVASIEFLTPSGTDAPEYSAEIREIFRDAGWKVPTPTGRLVTMNPPVRGFVIEVGDKTKPESRAARKALQALDNRVMFSPPSAGATAQTGMMIFVGSK